VTYGDLEAGREFWRYMDVDGDAICYRTIPGVHPTKGAYFTRGSSRNRYAKYSEEGSDYVDNMQRLLKKFETAKKYVPGPVVKRAQKPSRYGVIYYGSTGAGMDEAMAAIGAHNIHLDTMRIRSFPFSDEVASFIKAHDKCFVVEQNRDGQMRSLLINECAIDPQRLIPVLHYDGTPITARFITKEIADRLESFGLAGRTKVTA
jgi:2-oxoglutarate ferredoxin oxidoreductase subunit alpha